MMRYVSGRHGKDYEWFLRLDDDAYVHIENLESLLRKIDSSQALYVGSPGFGKHNEDFIEDNMVYCMGGPGIVLSKETLASLSPKLGLDRSNEALLSSTCYGAREYRNSFNWLVQLKR